jgi:hypothetical protein
MAHHALVRGRALGAAAAAGEGGERLLLAGR